jgi:hypothetical protein
MTSLNLMKAAKIPIHRNYSALNQMTHMGIISQGEFFGMMLSEHSIR